MSVLEEFARPEYPQASKYDPKWLLDLDMGPNPLWLLEDLARDCAFTPGMRVLDLGSGLGASSVFLAKEFGVEVWAADLWIPADRAAATFEAAGVADSVHAIHASAHDLPFGSESFDAIVSIDAYEYFGTADRYLAYVTGFLKPGGQLAVATPGMTREIREMGSIPEHIRELVGWEALAWHTAEWWRLSWELTGLVDVTAARLQENGWRDWMLWARACAEHGDPEGAGKVLTMLEQDRGEFLSFALVTARKGSGSD